MKRKVGDLHAFLHPSSLIPHPFVEAPMRIRSLRVKRDPLATASFVAFAVCLVLALGSGAVAAAGDKTRSQAERALRDGEFELAEKLFREVLTKDAHDNQARLGLSYTLFKMRRLRDAYDHAARVVANDPLSPRAHALLGSVVLASGDFRMSVEEFRTALSLDDSDALAIAGLAMVDFYENRLTASLDGLRRAVAINSSEPDFIYSLAQAAAR